MAGPFFSAQAAGRHFVPADKRLTPDWLRGLYARGAARVYRGKELNLVGMPVGGIAAGQMYLCGDGTLGEWKIFNQQYFSGYGKENYQPRQPEKPVEQGFALIIEDGTQTHVRRLDRLGCPEVELVAEYPLAWVRYPCDDLRVHAALEAFSPFIPLNARDSALPATILRFVVTNAANRPLRIGLAAWLENAVCLHSTRDTGFVVNHRSRMTSSCARTLLVQTAEPVPHEQAERPDILIADFEGGSYAGWTVEGEAFGERPATGTQPGQNPVTGFLGDALVNSYQGGDAPTGRLLSPELVIERRHINFLVGGGGHEKQTCINLLVEGQAVRTATGRDAEQLLWHSWDVAEFAGRRAQIEIVDAHSGAWGHINVDHIEQSDVQRWGAAGPLDTLSDHGEIVLALDGSAATPAETHAWLEQLPALAGRTVTAADHVSRSTERGVATLGAPLASLAPGEQRTFTFVLAWRLPNRTEGNMYAQWFATAADVAHYVLDNIDRLATDTHLWHDTYYDSTLPHWLLDRLHAPVANLATGTLLWWGSGRVWAWEGVGCCHGTCTHVWNYAHAMARLFPELERSVREMQDLGAALHESGLVGFRGERNEWYAADGQCGTVLKCYREHLMSPDDAFLKRNWPKIRQALEFSLQQDANADGLIENRQHNTFDIEFYGANTFVGSLYLAALRAGEEMARAVGDVEFADRARQVFESGQRLTVDRLWDGEYFIQDVDLDQHPKYQYGRGCLSDQLFGQGWAHHVGLGYVYPPEKVKSALQSVWTYNWAPDVGPQNAAYTPERWFAYPGDAGLFTCTWPKSTHLDKAGVRYRNEVWTGIEYQVAGHMIWEGLVEEGLAICRGIHDRYDPLRHNPFNEVECGDHYARALASWGVFTALAGYDYDGPRGRLGFAPRLTPENFRAAFTAAEGWGTFEQTINGATQRATVTLAWGRLRLTSLHLAVPAAVDRARISVRLGKRAVDVRPESDGARLALHFADALTLAAGESLEVSISA